MKTFVISLHRAVERRQFMTKQLDNLQIDYEIVDAVDYKELDELQLASLCDSEAIANKPYLVKGLIACSLSHLQVYARIIEQGIDHALVLEDDATLPSDIKLLVSEITTQINDDEVVSLSYYTHSEQPMILSNHGKKCLQFGYQLVYPVNIHDMASAMGYIIGRKTAEKMLTLLSPVSAAPDDWGNHFRAGAIGSFRCLYPVPLKPALFRSTLDYAANRSLLGLLASFVRKINMPCLNYFLSLRTEKRLIRKYQYVFSDVKPFNYKKVAS